MSEIKNCPCCGSEIKGGVRLTGYMTMNKQYIQCDACGLRMENNYYIDDMSETHLKLITEDLINRWNTRKPMEAIVKRLKGEIELVVTQFPLQGSYIKKTRAIEIVKEEGGIYN